MTAERTPPTRTFSEMKAEWLKDPEFKAEYERIEREEMPMLDAILKARAEAGLTQAQVYVEFVERGR